MKNSRNWKIDDLPWEQFDRTCVDPNILRIVKAAALVEYNAADYSTYLTNVFGDNADFCRHVRVWENEETQHGAALGAWAERADPSFNFQAAFARYRVGYRINLETDTSIRGSQSGELVARCVVEAGTSSYYTALGQGTREPVLQALCRHIAADEVRHYKMFYSYLEKSWSKEQLGRLKRLKIGLGRVKESEDDELAYAYFAANMPEGAVFNRSLYSSAYMACAFPLYQLDNLEQMATLVARACGFKLAGMWRKPISIVAQALLRRKLKQLHQQHAQLGSLMQATT